MPLDASHYAIVDGRPDLTPAEHIDRARVKLHRAVDCDRIGYLYFEFVSEAADHLRAAGLHELADRCDAICEDGFGGGGELAKIDEALATIAVLP